MKSQEERILQTARWCLLVTFLAGICAVASGGEPCCGIKSIDQGTGVVTAVDSASGRAFQFKVEDSKLLGSLRVGQKVYANFAAGKVSVNGTEPCCGIVAAGEAQGAAKPSAPCCGITGVDQRTGVVTAADKASGRTFQFAVTDARLLKSLRVGQAVWADFAARKISVDGISPCCGIK